MSTIPEDRKYMQSHEWLKLDADNIATIGITDYAQASLGDITYVQLPKAGASLKAGEPFGAVESVKAASDLYAPVAGTVVEVNAALDASPDLVNQSPFADGWMLKLKVADAASVASLMDAAAYAKLVG